MQLSRKTLQTTLPVIKLKVTPSYYPSMKTRWFWQNINFQNCPIGLLGRMIWGCYFQLGKLCFHSRHGHKNSKSLCKVDCWNSHLIPGSPRKRRQEKNCNKNNVLSKEKLKCTYDGAEILQVLFCYRYLVKEEQAKTGFNLTFQKWFVSFPMENNWKKYLNVAHHGWATKKIFNFKFFKIFTVLKNCVKDHLILFIKLSRILYTSRKGLSVFL